MMTTGGLVALVVFVVCGAVFLFVRARAKRRDAVRDEIAREEFRRDIVRYSGFCEPLLQCVHAGEAEHAEVILGALEGYMDEGGALLVAFRATCGSGGDACARAERWLRKLGGWGVGHDDVGDVIVVDRRREAQYYLDGMYEYGDRVRVVRPSWFWIGEPDGCIDRGIAQVVDRDRNKVGATLEG